MQIWNDLVADPIESGTSGLFSSGLAVVCAIALAVTATIVLVIVIRNRKGKKQ